MIFLKGGAIPPKTIYYKSYQLIKIRVKHIVFLFFLGYKLYICSTQVFVVGKRVFFVVITYSCGQFVPEER